MELRKDYILDRYVIIAENRGKRPNQFVKKADEKNDKICYFCPGNENLTPPEIGRIGSNEKWDLRWFPNKFSAVQEEGDPNIRNNNTYFTFASAFGYQEVIAETNDHEQQLWDLKEEQIKSLLKIYAQRINELSKKDNIKYVSIFKNHGRDAGTSLVHSHSQVVAYNKLPNTIREKIAAVNGYDHCPYCDIINIEKDSFRRCFENESFIAFTPYASRFNFEIWIFPKVHMTSITQMDDVTLSHLAFVLKCILLKLKEINAPYNMCLHYSPDSFDDLHFHIEICPRFATWAGFEMATGDIINSVTPEDAAAFYRGEIKDEQNETANK